MSERAKAFHAALEKSCIPRIDRATVPIVAVQDDKILHERTGVLYQIGPHYFVLTAAHGLREIVRHNIPLYISVNHPSVLPIPLTGANFLSTEEEDRDLAAIWIPRDIAAEVAQHKDFLRHNQINQHPDPSRALLLFYGYPLRWAGHLITETGMVSKALAFSSFEDYLDPKDVAHYDPKLHLLLNYSANAVQATTGESETLLPLQGISGCGIWQVGVKSDGSATPKTADTLTLVAIQHGMFKNHDRVKATRIEYALGLIADQYPDTKGPMSLAYPAG